jgi:hypothetical protein
MPSHFRTNQPYVFSEFAKQLMFVFVEGFGDGKHSVLQNIQPIWAPQVFYFPATVEIGNGNEMAQAL